MFLAAWLFQGPDAKTATCCSDGRAQPLQPDRQVRRRVRPALTFFRDRGIRVFICSSTAHELVREFVRRAGLDALVDDVSGYAAGLPKDRQIAAILHAHRLDPAEVILVGDSFADQDFARSAGVRFIGVARMFAAEEFRQRAMVSVADLAELTRLVERWGQAIRFVDARAPGAVAVRRDAVAGRDAAGREPHP